MIKISEVLPGTDELTWKIHNPLPSVCHRHTFNSGREKYYFSLPASQLSTCILPSSSRFHLTEISPAAVRIVPCAQSSPLISAGIT